MDSSKNQARRRKRLNPFCKHLNSSQFNSINPISVSNHIFASQKKPWRSSSNSCPSQNESDRIKSSFFKVQTIVQPHLLQWGWIQWLQVNLACVCIWNQCTGSTSIHQSKPLSSNKQKNRPSRESESSHCDGNCLFCEHSGFTWLIPQNYYC